MKNHLILLQLQRVWHEILCIDLCKMLLTSLIFGKPAAVLRNIPTFRTESLKNENTTPRMKRGISAKCFCTPKVSTHSTGSSLPIAKFRIACNTLKTISILLDVYVIECCVLKCTRQNGQNLTVECLLER